MEPTLEDLMARLERIEDLLQGREESLMTFAEVQETTTLSSSELKRRIDDGTFPEPIYLSPRRKAWRRTEIQAWIRELIYQAGAA